MYEKLLSLSKLVDRALRWYLVFLMAMLVGLTFGQVFSRYVMQSSWAGTEEWSRLVLVWITFMGTAAAVRRNKLIRIVGNRAKSPVQDCRILEHVFGFRKINRRLQMLPVERARHLCCLHKQYPCIL